MDMQPFLEADPDLPGHDPVGEEMIEGDLDPDEPGLREAFLQARFGLIRGTILPEDFLTEVRRLHRKFAPSY